MYIPRYWLDKELVFEEDVFLATDLRSVSVSGSRTTPFEQKIIRFDTCARCEFELCDLNSNNIERYGLNSAFYTATFRNQCALFKSQRSTSDGAKQASTKTPPL